MIAVFVLAVTAMVVAGDYRLFFQQPMLPAGDQASNDILIVDASRLALLHGNYSRVGFYHPGPFYLQWMALAEMAFVDLLPVFASPYAAQLFALAVLHAGALATVWALWLQICGDRRVAVAALLITAALPLAAIGVNYFIVAWPPYMYVPSALMAAAGVAGLAFGDVRWLPVFVFGLLQLVHGHASFIGLVPLMAGTAVAAAVAAGRIPLTVPRGAALMAFLRAHRTPLLLSVLLVAMFALPIALQTWLHWPGEIPKYFAFAGSPRTQGPLESLEYVLQLLPWAGGWLLLLVWPVRQPSTQGPAPRWRQMAVIAAATAGVPAWIYAWRGIDTLSEQYLILWVLPFFGVAGALTVMHVSTLLPRRAAAALFVIASLAAVYGLRPILPANLDERRAAAVRAEVMTRTAAEQLARDTGGRVTAVQIDMDALAWPRVWPDVAGLVAALHRRGVRELCIEPGSWHLLFHERFRCNGERVDQLLLATTRERADHWTIELPQAVLGDAPGAVAGETVRASALAGTGYTLLGAWSSAEEWGVWSSGRRAVVAINAARLPRHFTVRLQARLFPPPQTAAQRVRVLDGWGRPLASLSNATPGPWRLALDRGEALQDLVTLTFDVDAPVSPRQIGAGADDRLLGIGLETLTIEE